MIDDGSAIGANGLSADASDGYADGEGAAPALCFSPTASPKNIRDSTGSPESRRRTY
jgi:hypothetical protein